MQSDLRPGSVDPNDPLRRHLAGFEPLDSRERADLARVNDLLDASRSPWDRDLPLHLTASALIVHPASRRVLLRWHARQNAWLQVGGHGDPGETDPLVVALREGTEEAGLADLCAWPTPVLRHVAIVPVPANSREPAHEHADLRFFLATNTPDQAIAEDPTAALRWLSPTDAGALTTEANVRETIRRLARLLDDPTTQQQ